LFLAAIGTYAMISKAVAERTREFGIRLALGATAGRIIGKSAGAGLICAVLGSTIGLALAAFGTRFMQGMLYGVAAGDSATFVVVIGAVLLVTVIASMLPAIKIAKLDPSQTLRHE